MFIEFTTVTKQGKFRSKYGEECAKIKKKNKQANNSSGGV